MITNKNKDFLKNQIKDNSVDLIIADPPYGIMNKAKEWRKNISESRKSIYNFDTLTQEEFLSFSRKWIQECYKKLKSGGSIYIFSDTLLNLKNIIVEECFNIIDVITWHKTNPVPKFGKKQYLSSTEFIIFAVKGDKSKTFIFEKQNEMHNFIQTPIVQGHKRFKHPTQKPEEVIAKIMKVSSNKGDLVLDPFMGTNTTGAVAMKLERNYIGYEINKEYFEICKKRVEEIL